MVRGSFGLPLLYAARNNKARDAEGFTASGDDLATPTGSLFKRPERFQALNSASTPFLDQSMRAMSSTAI